MSAHMALAVALLAGAGIAGCLWLFLLVKAEMRSAGLRSMQRLEQAEAALNALGGALANLSHRLEETERNTGLLVPPPPTLSGFNLSKRSQAIRMHRRGETAGQIAAALQLPQGEVDLLLKVHRLVVDLATAVPKGP